MIDLDALERHNDDWGEIAADDCAALIAELRAARAVVDAARHQNVDSGLRDALAAYDAAIGAESVE